jgi:hypothetical protein
MENISYELFKIQVNSIMLNWQQKLSTQKERVELDDGVLSGFSWLRIGKSGGLFQIL